MLRKEMDRMMRGHLQEVAHLQVTGFGWAPSGFLLGYLGRCIKDACFIHWLCALSYRDYSKGGTNCKIVQVLDTPSLR